MQPLSDLATPAPIDTTVAEPIAPPSATFTSFFGENEALIEQFLEIAFLLQRNNTGGLTLYDVQSHNTILWQLHERYGLRRALYSSLINAINQNLALPETVFESQHFDYLKKQKKRDYLRIMAKYCDSHGYHITVSLSGNAKKDVETLDLLIHATLHQEFEFLSKNHDHHWRVKASNNWQSTLDFLEQRNNQQPLPKNVLVIAFCHDDANQGVNFRLYKTLVIIKALISYYIRPEAVEEFVTELSEMPSEMDEALKPQQFMQTDDGFLNITPAQNHRPNYSSDIVIFEDVDKKSKRSLSNLLGGKKPSETSIFDEERPLEEGNTAENYQVETLADGTTVLMPTETKVDADLPSKKPSFIHRIKALFGGNNSTNTQSVSIPQPEAVVSHPTQQDTLEQLATEIEVIPAFFTRLPYIDYRGIKQVGLFKPFEPADDDFFKKYYQIHVKQIFKACPKVKVTSLNYLFVNGFMFQKINPSAGFHAALEWQQQAI